MEKEEKDIEKKDLEKKEPVKQEETPGEPDIGSGEDLEELRAVQKQMLGELEKINQKLATADDKLENTGEHIKEYFQSFISKGKEGI